MENDYEKIYNYFINYFCCLDCRHSSVSSDLDVMKGRGLIREKNGQLHITVAAILLFGKYPTQFLPAAREKMQSTGL